MTAPPRRAGKLGKLPYDPSKPHLPLSPHLDAHAAASAPPAVPDIVDYLSQVADWPMYGNADWGDCVEADIGHAVETITAYGQGATVTVTDDDVLGAYSAITGFNPNAGPPGDNPTDQGTNMQDAMNWWRTTGMAGHRIVAFAKVDHTNDTELKAALNLFGVLCVGFAFPASAMTQFDNHQPWSVVTGSPIEGGHAVHVAYDSTTIPQWRCVTWAAVQAMTGAFWQAYVDEVWVPISQEWVNAAGASPTGLDLSGLGEQFAELTGEPNPFPSPAPPPGPPLDTVDQTLAAALRPWVNEHHIGATGRVAKALRAWLAAKGL